MHLNFLLDVWWVAIQNAYNYIAIKNRVIYCYILVISQVILEWRRINGALTKVVFPYQRECTPCVRLAMDRVHGCTQSYTATGRVTMSEPNIQNIPNDFDIDLPGENFGRWGGARPFFVNCFLFFRKCNFDL